MKRSALRLAVGVLLVPILGCGAGGDETEPVTFEGWVGSVVADYDPATSLNDLSARSTVVVEATLLDIEDGAVFGSSPDDDAASHSVNLIFESTMGDRYYVEQSRPADIAVEDLRSVMPLGALSVIYLQPNDDPRDQNFFNVREGPTWFFTTPQGWILDDPELGIITPLEGSSSLGFDPPSGGDSELQAWLVDPKPPSA